MDTPTLEISDLTVLALVLAGSAAAVPLALLAGSRLKLDRFAQCPSSLNLLAAIAAGALGVMSLCVLLGYVPADALLSWWGAIPASLAVLGTLVLVAVAATSKPREKAADPAARESESGKLAA